MIRSMTGFGRERMMLGGRDILVEIKLVVRTKNTISMNITSIIGVRSMLRLLSLSSSSKKVMVGRF